MLKKKNILLKLKHGIGIEEDKTAEYIKCELSGNKVLVIIPDDELIYIGEIISNMKYERVSEDKISYNNVVFRKTGDGHQFIKNIEFGSKDEVEGKCVFEDYEAENNIISLGVLPDKNNVRADVFADILELEDIELV